MEVGVAHGLHIKTHSQFVHLPFKLVEASSACPTQGTYQSFYFHSFALFPRLFPFPHTPLQARVGGGLHDYQASGSRETRKSQLHEDDTDNECPQNLAPTYEQLADAFAHAKDKVIVAKVDADGAGKPLGQKYGVTGFPSAPYTHSRPCED